jgi:rifampicin phosphotransferase
MMKDAIPLDSLAPKDRGCVGPGAWALSVLGRKGFSIPRSLCITTHAYDEYVEKTGLKERILMELNRRIFHDLLWEEIWDACLRIRGMFLNIPMPLELRDRLKLALDGYFGTSAVAIRLSSPGEDPFLLGTSPLGGPPSGISGAYSILDSIRLAWASACADCKALAFRGMGAESSSAAVIIQEMPSDCVQGRAFCPAPGNGGMVIVEYGMKQGVMGCSGEPGYWVLEASSGRVLSRSMPDGGMAPSEEEVLEVSDQGLMALRALGPEWEVEWALKGGILHIIQARPVTAGLCLPEGRSPGGSGDIRHLRDLVEKSFIPCAAAEADAFSSRPSGGLADAEFQAEISRRREASSKWAGLYRDMVVPLAYATVIFGNAYNDAMRPVDPYEFADLLMPPELPELRKDILLEKMAGLARRDGALLMAIRRHALPVGSGPFAGLFREYLEGLGGEATMAREGRAVLELVLRLAEKLPGRHGRRHLSMEKLTEDFLGSLPPEKRRHASGALDFARTACRLQNEAAFHVRRIERLEEEAIAEERRRLASRGGEHAPGPGMPDGQGQGEPLMKLSARQLPGRSYCSGMARGQARVVRGESDLSGLKAGEIMVCDRLDPGMAAVVPLAEAVVVERGVMFREGVAIARKYGLPYVTGVSDATRFIRTGDRVTVDGHLGLVIIEKGTAEASGGGKPWTGKRMLHVP